MISTQQRQTGFTLIELIITIVVIGIMVMGIAGFIELGTKGYADTVDRQQLQNQARFVVEKMTREIRHAVPNSFDVFTDNNGGQCLSFFPIDYSGSYVMLEENNNSVSDRFRFVVVNSSVAPEVGDLENEKMVINPATPDDLNPNTSNQSIVLSGVARNEDNIYSIDFEDDFNSGNVVPSPASRLYIYSHKVTYCQEAKKLTRQIDSQLPVQVGEDLETASFADGTANGEDALARSALIHMRLLFQRGDEKSNYETDVQVMNVP